MKEVVLVSSLSTQAESESASSKIEKHFVFFPNCNPSPEDPTPGAGSRPSVGEREFAFQITSAQHRLAAITGMIASEPAFRWHGGGNVKRTAPGRSISRA